MQILSLIVVLVGMAVGMMVSPLGQGRADAEEERLANPVSVWAQRRMAAEAAIRAQVHVFTRAFNDGDAQALGALYTRDAVLLPPGQAQIAGRDEITHFWEAAIGAGLEGLVLAPVEIAIVRDTAYEIRTLAYEIRTLTLSGPTEGGERRLVETKSIVVWQEDVDGIWRLHRDIWTVIPPMPRLEPTQ
jgi:uncharacterized protein (TIGR02246 family)